MVSDVLRVMNVLYTKGFHLLYITLKCIIRTHLINALSFFLLYHCAYLRKYAIVLLWDLSIGRHVDPYKCTLIGRVGCIASRYQGQFNTLQEENVCIIRILSAVY